MKLRANRGGHGHVTSYTLSVGSREAREAGFVDQTTGEPLPLRKIVDPEHHRVIIELDTNPARDHDPSPSQA